MVPEDVRLAYRIMKNGGVVPPEIDLLRELNELEARVAREGAEPLARAAARLEFLRLRLAESGCRVVALHPKGAYLAAVAARFMRSA